MLGMLVLAIADLRRLLRTADIAAAMCVEAQMATDRVFAADLQALRPQLGQAASRGQPDSRSSPARGVVASHREDRFNRVQDAYSLRCSPQVHGAARDTVDHAALVAGRELASAVDNPVGRSAEDGGRVESNGNFHGAPVAYVLDFLAIVAADVASISERRTDRFLDRARNHGLPPFLADDPGVDSGQMIAQYTQAAIVSELKRLAVPGQRRLDPLQRDAGGPRLDGLVRRPQAAPLGRRAHPGGRDRAADRRARRSTCARPLRARRPATGAVVALLRDARCRGPGPDRYLSPEIEAAVALVASGAVLDRRRRSDRRARMTDADQPPSAHPRPARHRADREVAGRPRRRCGC